MSGKFNLYGSFVCLSAIAFSEGNYELAAGFIKDLYRPFVLNLLQTNNFVQSPKEKRRQICKAYVDYTVGKFLLGWKIEFSSVAQSNQYAEFWAEIIMRDQSIQMLP